VGGCARSTPAGFTELWCMRADPAIRARVWTPAESPIRPGELDGFRGELEALQGELDAPPQLQSNPRFWLRVAIAGGATFAVGAAWAIIIMQYGGWTHGSARGVDLLLRLHRHLPSLLDWLVVMLPWLGTNLVLIPVLGPGCWYLWHKQRRPDLAILVAVTAIGNFVIGMALKLVFERPRPTLWVSRGEFTGSAYPSGHAMAMTSVIGVIAVLLYEERHTISPLVAWMILLFATCYSRLYLGVHWPSDVVGGLLAGDTWFFGMLWARRTDVAARPAVPSVAIERLPGRPDVPA
jgi:membrane-associated phospholipid phosphatase